MPITYSKQHKRLRFEFDRHIPGAGRQRASRLLPKAWTRAKADEFDRIESARLYAVATGVEQQTVRTIDEAVLIYLDNKQGLKSVFNIEAELLRCFEFYVGRPITALPSVAAEYVKAAQDFEKKLSPATIHNRLAYLRAACRFAWKKHGYCQHDPAEKMVMPTVNNERQVYLSEAQVLRIASAIQNDHARAALMVGFYSGMRESEILRARVIDDCFALDDTKNGTPRRIPVHAELQGIISDPALWPLKVSKWTISHEFMKANRSVGVPGAVFHSVRHSTASEMINNGVDLHTVGAVLGHKSAVSTKRYAHLATATLRSALGKVGQKSSHMSPKAAA